MDIKDRFLLQIAKIFESFEFKDCSILECKRYRFKVVINKTFISAEDLKRCFDIGYFQISSNTHKMILIYDFKIV
jgi:hypothetical protein